MFILEARAPRIIVFVALDVLAIGMGMGVPIFAILLGFPVGWFIAALLRIRSPYSADDLKTLLRTAVLTSSVTFAIMAIVWLPTLRMLNAPAADVARFGIPLILYEPVPSFIGWIVLMVVISPVLQMLATLFGGVSRWALRPVDGVLCE